MSASKIVSRKVTLAEEHPVRIVMRNLLAAQERQGELRAQLQEARAQEKIAKRHLLNALIENSMEDCISINWRKVHDELVPRR